MDEQRKRVLCGMVSGFLFGLTLNLGLAYLFLMVWMHHMFIIGVSNWSALVVFVLLLVLCVVTSILLGVKALRAPTV